MSERLLLWYRMHDPDTGTHTGAETKDKGGAGSQYWNGVRNDIINKLIN